MKNIFIVTDFSDASKNAGRYGIEMARFFNANVFLFHSYQVPLQVPESYLVYNTEDVWATVKEQLETEAAFINPGKLINVEICGGVGIPSEIIIQEATSRHADLIICGMKGHGTTFRKIFGSTTTALSRKTVIPLIVVPENAEFRYPENISLATDMDPETSPDTFSSLKEIGEKFSSKLSIVWVVEELVDAAYEMRFQPMEFVSELKDMHPVFEFPTGSNIAKTLELFVKDHEIDMMVIVPHKHDMLERIIKESVTRKMLFHTEIPLLVLPQKKREDEKTEINQGRTAEVQ